SMTPDTSGSPTAPPTAGWTLQTLLDELERHGEHTALLAVKQGGLARWSFTELAGCARRLAAGLLRDGLQPGEAVFLMGRASPDWVVVRLALGAVGALAVPCDHLASPEEARRLLRAGGCRRAFVSAEHLAMLRGLAGDEPLTIHLLEGEEIGRAHV